MSSNDSFRTRGDSFADRHGKTLVSWIVAGLVMWFTLEKKVDQKADRVELQAVYEEVRTVQQEHIGVIRDVKVLVDYICQDQPRSLGCQQRQ